MNKNNRYCGKLHELSMYGFSKYEAQERYDTFNTVQVKLKLNQKTDADILAWIRQHKYGRETSVQGAIKALIREDIARAQAGGGGGAGLIPHAFDLPQAALERNRFKAHLLTFSDQKDTMSDGIFQ